jgi:Leucine-rich repeat (LRR) protein
LVLVGGVVLAQLIIRITDKDGKVQEVAVPPGAKVEIVPKEQPNTNQAKINEDPTLKQWIEDTKKLPPEKQVEAVARKLVGLNPGFDGKVTHTIEKGAIHDLAFNTDNIADLEPLRALPQLRRLFCAGHWPCKGKVRDLSPLRTLRQLYLLECNHNPVEDLAPLQGLPIKYLRVDNGVFRSLKPLEGMPLINLCVAACPNVSDLSPLRGMRLGRFACNVTAVSDLSPLQDMPLWYIDCRNTRVTDLSVAKTWTGLKELLLDFKPERDTELLCSIKTLEKINDKLVAGFLKPAATNAAFEQWLKDTQKLPAEKQVEAVAKKLQELNPGFDGKVEPNIVDSKVAGLSFSSVEVSDLAPLRALPELRTLDCSGTPDQQGKLSDLAPLIALTRLDKLTISRTAVADLAPLRKLPLSFLHCYEILVEDLSPVKNMPLQKIGCDPDLAQSNRATLQAVKSLQTINNKPAAVFWKEVNAKKP